jgi:MscS family membrane protein
VLSEVRNVVMSHAKIDTKTVRVRLVELASASLNVELVCYVLTLDFNEYAEVREELLLSIMSFVEDSGTNLATPSQTLYLGKDSGSDKDKISAVMKQTAGPHDGPDRDSSKKD